MDYLCAICVRENHSSGQYHKANQQAVTSVNGTAVCEQHACEAPETALPYSHDITTEH